MRTATSTWSAGPAARSRRPMSRSPTRWWEVSSGFTGSTLMCITSRSTASVPPAVPPTPTRADMTYVSPLMDLPGAVPPPDRADGTPSRDTGVPHHYGDPLREQRALLPGANGFVDLSHRPVIAVSGVDRLSWLHSLTTQHVEHLADGESALNLVLSPNGHVEHELHQVEHDGVVLISTEPGDGEGLAAYLDKMRFMLRVEVADVTA